MDLKSSKITGRESEYPARASFARAHTGTEEIAVRKEKKLTSNLLVAEQLDGDQSPLRPATRTGMVGNRRGRPRKDVVRANTVSIEQVIHDARAELKGCLLKTKEIIQRVGQALEDAGIKPSKICRRIKKEFAEEIRKDLIHPRTIENYCLDKWKIETKPRKKGQKNAKRSFSESEATPPTERTEEASGQTTPQEDAPLQKVYVITEEKFAAVREAMDRSKDKCYLRFNENDELYSIAPDGRRGIEATISE